MPTPGDVDCVMAAELMEAGRSVLRGLVTPDRTTLIASTHRSPAIVEKQAPGDGVADPHVVVTATEFAARRTISFDMEKMAKAKAASFRQPCLGRSLRPRRCRFRARRLRRPSAPAARASSQAFAPLARRSIRRRRVRPSRCVGRLKSVLSRGRRNPEAPSSTPSASKSSDFPMPAQPMLAVGARRLVDYLDPSYAREYFDRLAAIVEADRLAGGEARGFAFSVAAAKYLAAAMAYDDLPRVADLKIRSARQARVRQETGAADSSLVTTTEFFHPRVDELCATLPAAIGGWIEARPRLVASLRKLVDRGRRISPNTIYGLFDAGLRCKSAAPRGAVRFVTGASWRISTPGSRPRSRSCRSTTTSASACSAAGDWSRVIPTRMRAASRSSTG